MLNKKRHNEVKLILNNKLYRKKLQYFVKWLSWLNVENQWIYVDDVQIDELIKNFYQQYFHKLNENASNAKKNKSKIIDLLLHRHKIDHDNTKFNYFSKF
jgi:hypothetical protein